MNAVHNQKFDAQLHLRATNSAQRVSDTPENEKIKSFLSLLDPAKCGGRRPPAAGGKNESHKIILKKACIAPRAMGYYER